MATRDRAENSWWTLDSESPAPSWRPDGSSILDGLIESVPAGGERRPWSGWYELQISGLGGLVNKERRHYTVLGDGEYVSQVNGRRNVTATSQTTSTQGNRAIEVAIANNLSDLDPDVSWGTDSLTVEGDADITVGSRMVMMTGTVDRVWKGGIMRLASMEGSICGGAFLRTHAGLSMNLSAMMTGDVYGGCARVSAVRTYLAVLQYRAAKAAAWAMGVYVRHGTFVIEPIVSTPSDKTPPSNLAKKLARLGKTLEVARMLCPPLDIAVGLVTLPVAIYGIGKFIYALASKKEPVPPTGPPRTRVRTVGLTNQTMSSLTVT